MASVSRDYQTADISEESRKILLALWRKTTTSAYSSAWTKWNSWCSQCVNVDPISPSLTSILDFLAFHFREGERTINVYGSALSAVLHLIDGHKGGSPPLVCQMLIGEYQLRPRQIFPLCYNVAGLESSIIYCFLGFKCPVIHKAFILQACWVTLSYCPKQSLGSSSP